MATLTCDPAALVAAAKCFECVPPEMREPLELYLMATIAGGSMDPATLVKDAACFQCIPQSERGNVLLYLTCKGAGGT